MVQPDYSLHYPILREEEEEEEVPLTIFRGFPQKRKRARARLPWFSVLTRRVNEEGVCTEQKAGTAARWLLAACSVERPHHLRVTFVPDDEDVLLATKRKDGTEEDDEEEEEEDDSNNGIVSGENKKDEKKGDGKSAVINDSPTTTPTTQPLRPHHLQSSRTLVVTKATSHIEWSTPPSLLVNTPLSTLPTPQGGHLNARLLPTSPILALEGVGVGVSTLVNPDGKLISSSRGLHDRLIAYSLGSLLEPYSPLAAGRVFDIPGGYTLCARFDPTHCYRMKELGLETETKPTNPPLIPGSNPNSDPKSSSGLGLSPNPSSDPNPGPDAGPSPNPFVYEDALGLVSPFNYLPSVAQVKIIVTDLPERLGTPSPLLLNITPLHLNITPLIYRIPPFS